MLTENINIKKVVVTKKNSGENLKNARIFIYFNKKKAEVINFHLRPCLLKLIESFLKYLILATFSGYVTSKMFFFFRYSSKNFESTHKHLTHP